MKFEIIGAGALGLLFGAKLLSAGHEVTFWTRTHHQADLLTNQGYILEESNGSIHQIEASKFEARYIKEAVEIGKYREADWVFITTKQRHLDRELLSIIQSLHGEKTGTLCFQNGMGHVEKLSASLKGRRIYTAVTTEGGKRIGTERVIRSGVGNTTIGIVERRSPNSDQSEDKKEKCGCDRGENLVNTLVIAGFPAFLSKDIDREIFRKLLINAVVNPLTALWRVPNGELLETEERRKLLRQLCQEGATIYQANGISYDPDLYEQVSEVCRSTAGNISSMLNDVLQGVPTEVDFINGYLVEMGRSAGVSAPGHEMVWQLIRGLPSTNRISV